MFSTAETEARRPLLKAVRQYANVRDDEPTRELIRKATGQAAENARMEPQPPTDDERNAWLAGHLIAEMNGDEGVIGSVMAQFVAEVRNEMRDEFEAKFAEQQNKIDQQQDRIATLEQQQSFEAKFCEMEMRNIEREERRNESKRGPVGRQGERGARGERGLQGSRGPAGKPAAAPPKICAWKLDRERYQASPLMSDGSTGATLDLRPLYEQYQFETS